MSMGRFRRGTDDQEGQRLNLMDWNGLGVDIR